MPGRSERSTAALFGTDGANVEAARARVASGLPGALLNRRGPMQLTRAQIFAQRARPMAAAGACRRALVASDARSSDAIANRARWMADYAAWYNALVPYDPNLRHLQPHGPWPVCKTVAMEFVLQLPQMLEEGVRRVTLARR
jgi:hypothetical protein